MDRLEPQRPMSRFDPHVTHRPKSHSAAGIKGVKETFRLIGTELLLNHPKKIRLDAFKLKVRSVLNPFSARRTLCSATFQWLGNQTAFFG